MTGDIFTSGTWVVPAGKEDDFVAAWTEFAEWTKANISGAGWVVLLRDAEQPNRFTSLGPWESAAHIEAWRASDGFRERLGRLEDMAETFDATRLERVGGLD